MMSDCWDTDDEAEKPLVIVVNERKKVKKPKNDDCWDTDEDADSSWEETETAVVDANVCTYDSSAVLGAGKYGEVYEGKDKIQDRVVAVKKISKPDDMTKFIEYYDIIKDLYHPAVIKHFKYVEVGDSLHLMTEFGENGTLQAEIDRRKKSKPWQYMIEPMVLKWFRDLVSGVDYLHRNGVIHRDLKPENIVIGRQKYLKIIDLGSAKIKCQKNDEFKCTSIMGNNCAAPELLDRKPYNKSVDVWSLGVILFQMADLKHPYWKQGPPYVAPHLSKLSNCSRDLDDVVQMTMMYEPKKRATIDEIKRERIFYRSVR